MKCTAASKLLGFVLVVVLASSASFGAEYRYSKIQVPNSVDTLAQGVNARGDVVGYYDDSTGNTYTFLLRNGVFSTIASPNGTSIQARAINARGDIAGGLQDAKGEHGFVLSGGQFTIIDHPGALSTTVEGINNAGDLTGTWTGAQGNQRGFILKSGKFQEISVPSSVRTDVYMARDNGRVMVGDTVTSDGQHGFVRDASGQFTIFDPPGTLTPCTFARYTSERGDIAGAFAIVNSSDECNSFPNTQGFVLRQGQYTFINFPGSSNTFVQTINDDGVIVGIFVDAQGTLHGFKAVPGN